MATQGEKIREAFRRVKDDTNSIRVQIAGGPDVAELPLETAAKNLVDAVNEVKALADNAAGEIDPGNLAAVFESA